MRVGLHELLMEKSQQLVERYRNKTKQSRNVEGKKGNYIERKEKKEERENQTNQLLTNERRKENGHQKKEDRKQRDKERKF